MSEDEGTVYRVAACGECVEGKCDECAACQDFASSPGAKPHEARWFGGKPLGADSDEAVKRG